MEHYIRGTCHELKLVEQEQSSAEGSTLGVKLALQDHERSHDVPGCQIVSVSRVSLAITFHCCTPTGPDLISTRTIVALTLM